jgi:hypothetical protein
VKIIWCLILILFIVTITFMAAHAGVLDTGTTLLRYGVSNEPFTFSDTVTVTKWYKSGNWFYLKTLTGELWAAWAVPERK